MILIGKVAEFTDQTSYYLTINNKNLLLIHHDDHYYLIGNQCGHFGAPLSDAQVKNKQIICAQHGISFSLETGHIINRPYENCEPITVYPIQIKDNSLYCSDL